MLVNDNDANVLIYVPQGCYAEISKNTPHNVVGLITCDMHPCRHVMVTNKETGSVILCHADATTDLGDENDGIMAWIGKVCPNEDYRNLIVSVGKGVAQNTEAADISSSADSEQTTDLIYNQIDTLLKEKDIEIIGIETESYNICIKRGMTEPVLIPTVTHDKYSFVEEMEEQLSAITKQGMMESGGQHIPYYNPKFPHFIGTISI